jgi:TRAP-type mannitol/chloroaromatic compound transport system permease small subunit
MSRPVEINGATLSRSVSFLAVLAAIRRPLDAISAGMAYIGGWLFLGVAFFVSFEVTARKLFNITTNGTDELSSYVLAIATTWACAHVLTQKGHVRIDILWSYFSVPLRAWLNIVALATLNLFLGLLVVSAWQMVIESVQLGAQASTPLSTPLVYPQALWACGLTWFLLLGGLTMLEAMGRLAAGEVGLGADKFGPAVLEDELAREMEAAGGGATPAADLLKR